MCAEALLRHAYPEQTVEWVRTMAPRFMAKIVAKLPSAEWTLTVAEIGDAVRELEAAWAPGKFSREEPTAPEGSPSLADRVTLDPKDWEAAGVIMAKTNLGHLTDWAREAMRHDIAGGLRLARTEGPTPTDRRPMILNSGDWKINPDLEKAVRGHGGRPDAYPFNESCPNHVGGHVQVKVEAAYGGVSDLRYSGVCVDGVDQPVAAVAWCSACGALGVAKPNEPFVWRRPGQP